MISVQMISFSTQASNFNDESLYACVYFPKYHFYFQLIIDIQVDLKYQVLFFK